MPAPAPVLPSCGPGKHDIAIPDDPNVRVVRCRRCGHPVGLYAPTTCHCGAAADLFSTRCGHHG